LGAARGRFAEHVRRDDLWRLLMHLTRQKSVDYVREQTRKKRGGGEVRGESVFLAAGASPATAGIEQFVGDEPTPEYLAMMNEEHARLLASLPDDQVRDVAVRRMRGESNDEIATALGLSVRSVERKLSLIRARWETEL
jgi:DNA-directed RNA polymerase specialized sigma24 family protein